MHSMQGKNLYGWSQYKLRLGYWYYK